MSVRAKLVVPYLIRKDERERHPWDKYWNVDVRDVSVIEVRSLDGADYIPLKRRSSEAA